jgi:hypothetical protein
VHALGRKIEASSRTDALSHRPEKWMTFEIHVDFFPLGDLLVVQLTETNLEQFTETWSRLLYRTDSMLTAVREMVFPN